MRALHYYCVLYLALGLHACVRKIHLVPLPPCQNFHSKPSDRVEPHQPVTKASVSLGLPLSVRPPRRAQELKHMRKLNRHPNSLPYTKQFKWYSLERWQVLMSLSVRQKGRRREAGRQKQEMEGCLPSVRHAEIYFMYNTYFLYVFKGNFWYVVCNKVDWFVAW